MKNEAYYIIEYLEENKTKKAIYLESELFYKCNKNKNVLNIIKYLKSLYQNIISISKYWGMQKNGLSHYKKLI